MAFDYVGVMLRQYIYVSTAPNLSAKDVDSILESSQRNNAARGVTGILLYNGRNFLQLLEGEEADLLWVIRRIGADPRHSGISHLEDVAAERRACPEWKMRHIKLIDDVSKRREALGDEIPDSLDPNLSRIILNFAALN